MIPETINDSARTLLYNGLAQTDVDMANHRLLNLDTSNLPPVGIPPTVHPPTSQWLHDWDAILHQWTATQPSFRDLLGSLTNQQMLNIVRVGTITAGTWAATPISPAYLPRLDQILEPQANVNMNQQRLTNLATPVNAADAVTLGYMDFLLQGLNPKASVRLATTGQRSLAGLDLPVDGVLPNAGDRILVKNQFIVRDNGIYVAATGAWTRDTDADHGSGDAGETPGNDINRAYCTVREGTLNQGTSWVNSTPCVHINDASPGKVFVLFSVAFVDMVIAGNGLNRIGNVLNVLGTPHRISVASTVDIDSTYAGQASITTLGTITTGTWEGLVIDSSFGGTGVNNLGNTIQVDCPVAVNLVPGALGPSLTLRIGGASVLTLPLVGTLATIDGVERFSNKRITPRVQQIMSNANPNVNIDTLDVFYITFLSEPILSVVFSGTPDDGQELVMWIKDNGTPGGWPITWGGLFGTTAGMPLPTNTVTNQWWYLKFVYNSVNALWFLIMKLNPVFFSP